MIFHVSVSFRSIPGIAERIRPVVSIHRNVFAVLLVSHAAFGQLDADPREEGHGDEKEEEELAVVGGHGSADSTTE